jgi:hypothetical protein
MLIFLFYKKFYMHALWDKKQIHIDFFLIWKIKTFYLSNDNFDLRFGFTNKSLSMRSWKVAPILVCFENIFFRLKFINPSAHELSATLHMSYQWLM